MRGHDHIQAGRIQAGRIAATLLGLLALLALLAAWGLAAGQSAGQSADDQSGADDYTIRRRIENLPRSEAMDEPATPAAPTTPAAPKAPSPAPRKPFEIPPESRPEATPAPQQLMPQPEPLQPDVPKPTAPKPVTPTPAPATPSVPPAPGVPGVGSLEGPPQAKPAAGQATPAAAEKTPAKPAVAPAAPAAPAAKPAPGAKPAEQASSPAPRETPETDATPLWARRRPATVTAEVNGSATTITVQSVFPVAYRTFLLEDPSRVVIDVLGVFAYKGDTVQELARGPVARVRSGEHSDKLRVVLDLRRPASADVHPLDGGVKIVVRPKG